MKQLPRRIPHTMKEEVDRQVTSMMDAGVITASSSPWSSPVVLVKKRDGGVRFCVDYRRLNSVTLKDSYPLPRIDDTLDALSGAKYFSTLDLASGYWQVPVAEQDKEKTAFVTQRGLWQFNKMPFGLANAPATFQRMMEVVLAGLQWSECLIYLDDVIVFSVDLEDHVRRLELVFERLRKANLKLKPSKCQFMKSEVCYLGHKVSGGGISPDPVRVEAVGKYPLPSDPKQLKVFLGMAGYYRRFVPRFSEVAAPLYELLRKGATFEWTKQCDEAFKSIRSTVATAPLLAFPDFNNEFELSVDASDVGLGAVLHQTVNGSQSESCQFCKPSPSQSRKELRNSRKRNACNCVGDWPFQVLPIWQAFCVANRSSTVSVAQEYERTQGKASQMVGCSSRI